MESLLKNQMSFSLFSSAWFFRGHTEDKYPFALWESLLYQLTLFHFSFALMCLSSFSWTKYFLPCSSGVFVLLKMQCEFLNNLFTYTNKISHFYSTESLNLISKISKILRLYFFWIENFIWTRTIICIHECRLKKKN